MTDPLAQHLTDMWRLATALAKDSSSQRERVDWYYAAVTFKAQLDGLTVAPPVSVPASAKPAAVTTKAGVKVPLTVSIPTPTPGVPTWPPAGSVQISPGENWQTKVNANPAGTVFAIMPGTHANATVRPKTGNQFLGAPGTSGTYGPTGLTSIMDGTTVTVYAFDAQNANDVVIANLEIKNYHPPGQYGCIEQTNNNGHTTANWLIHDVDVHHSSYGGIGIGTGSTCRDSRTHHNLYMGYTSAFSTGATFLNVEIDHNHTASDDPYVEASGGKCAVTTGLTLDSCYAHDNSLIVGGPGMWTDINNYQTTYRNCIVDNNGGAGIFHEISYDYTIHDCTLTGNGIVNGGWIWNAGIQIAASGSVAGNPVSEVYNNTITGGRHGIALIQQNRGSGNRGTYLVQNNYVHHNTVQSWSTYHGAVQDVGSNAIFTSRNNVFDYNTYHVKNSGYAWMNTDTNFAGWQAAGNDIHGTFA